MNRILVAFLLLLLPICSFAQQLAVRNISMENGLPSNAVRSIVQDKDGFVWLGTDNGLCRYDGYTIRPLRIPQLQNDQYVGTLEVSKYGLLVGTSHGAFLLNARTEQFRSLHPKIHGNVMSFGIDADGNIWVVTLDDGVFCVCRNLSGCVHYGFKKGSSLVSVYVDSENQVWLIARKQGLYKLNRARRTFELFPIKGQTHFDGMCMAEASEGRMLVGSWNDGLLMLSPDGTMRQLTNPLLTGAGTHIHTIYRVSPNEFLLGCDEGVMQYNLLENQWSMISNAFSIPGAAGRFVYSILRDREGGFWFGTYYGGVNYYSPMDSRFLTLTGENGLHGNVVGRFCEDNNHRIWIATDDGGLNCYDPRLKTFVDFPGKAVLAKYNVHGLLSEGNTIWVGTYGRGLIQLNTQTGAMKTYVVDKSGASSSCYSLLRDRQGRLWAGTMTCVSLYNNATDKFSSVRATGGTVIDIEEDRNGNVWFGTLGDGLWKLGRNGKWKHYLMSTAISSLSNNSVNAIREDLNGNLYIATDDGLCVYEPKADRFRRIPVKTDSNVFTGLVINQGELWLSSSTGLVHILPGGKLHVFNREDGLLPGPFQSNAMMMSADGGIWLGSVNGVSMFYPYQIKENRCEPNVFITAFEVYNKDVKVGSDKLPEALGYVDYVNLSHGDNMFTIHFAALSYVSPEKNQYAYRLDGFDKDWIYVGAEHKAVYTNIPPGEYTFRVKASNNDGLWSSKEATLKIVIHPPFYWSLPAKLFYLLAFFAVIYLYVHMRLQKAERLHQRRLKEMNERKEKEMRDAQLHFFTMIAHEIRTPVSLIIGPLETLKTQWQKIGRTVSDSAAVSSTLDVIDRNAQRLLGLVNQLLDFNKVQQKELKVRFTLCHIKEIMRAVAERFEPTLRQNGATLKVEYPDDDFVAAVDAEGLTKIISNLMTNATKYTKDRVRLTCVVEQEQFVIEVEDNGCGIGPEEQQRIFNPFYQAKDNKPGTGIGLSIVSNLVAAHRGKVEVKSEVGKGSLFQVTLPVSQPGVTMDEGPKPEVVDDMLHGEASAAEDVISKQTVLVVEDNEDMLLYLKHNFMNRCQVLTAEDGVEALKLLNKYNVSLIISDWMMPNMDGEELCRKIRQNPKTSHIPFIMLTAKTDDDSKVKSMDIGVDAFIAKPFSMRYLDACVRNLMAKRKQLMEEFAGSPEEPIAKIADNAIDSSLLTDMEKIIEDNVNNPALNVNFVAQQLGMSRSGLFAKIKSLTDTTPNEMIQVIRLRKAAQMLLEDKYSVSEISFLVGFNSASYFTKCFVKQFGVRPAEYREEKKR